MKTRAPDPTPPDRLRLATLAALLAPAGLLGACAAMDAKSQQRQVASLLAFLYPGKEPPAALPEVQTVLNVPFRVGIAFVPDTSDAVFRLAEAERQRLADRVRTAFRDYPFIREIEIVPSTFLQAGGGFENLDRVPALLRLDVVVLVSFDKVQHAGANRWSFLYWTGVGAYLVEGDQYDILTALEVSVFDVRSRRLLMHAGGRSTIKGEATWVGFAERSRAARTASFEKAFDEMTAALQREVAAFRERAPRDPSMRLVLPPGYNPGTPPR
ncbi:MAG: rhombotarget lipoprotein [Rubrivivax sp.]